MHDKKSFVEICHALHLIQAKNIQKWLIAGKLSQVGKHHYVANRYTELLAKQKPM